jgi:hypothetical protein
MLLRETLGNMLASQTTHLSSQGVSGGILIACDPNLFDMTNITYTSTFSISVRIKSRLEDQEWDITGVYGPQNDNEKLAFFEMKVTVGRAYSILLFKEIKGE